jgi:hypothetical protein
MLSTLRNKDSADKCLAEMRRRLDVFEARVARREYGSRSHSATMNISQMRRRIREHIARWGDPIVPKMVEGDL